MIAHNIIAHNIAHSTDCGSNYIGTLYVARGRYQPASDCATVEDAGYTKPGVGKHSNIWSTGYGNDSIAVWGIESHETGAICYGISSDVTCQCGITCDVEVTKNSH